MIMDLPNEILREIILQLLRILPTDFNAVPLEFESLSLYEDPVREVLRLSGVCSLWRRIINDMPRVWSTIVIKPEEPIDIPRLETIILAKWTISTVIDLEIECHNLLRPLLNLHTLVFQCMNVEKER
ncbi:hypothetical protein M422DRAFT_265715 [Sphaerobolus stellatus SS14]|uniref:F-box domain-containing protein n=1 Tax=Sphaerobolus stellatus (strain SS14) TaxID=990650 RepID=A0A0C9TQK0_SPHS4|nr:hypothetical protein M422DRAFT_265715 [Sphaerobolus stellatus SS14]